MLTIPRPLCWRCTSSNAAMRSLDSLPAPRLESPLLLGLPGSSDAAPFELDGKRLPHQQDDTPLPSPLLRTHSPKRERTGLRVLVVDDNPIALACACAFFLPAVDGKD